MTRRQLLLTGSTLATSALALQGCTAGVYGAADRAAYEAAVRDTWRHGKRGLADFAAVQRELVRYATLAPSSHNTQCWLFAFQRRGVSIRPDFARRCPAVDPDDHHLFVSLGCAAENLVQAAAAQGYHAEAVFDDKPDAALSIALTPTKAIATPLFEAIPSRQCTRGEYDRQPLTQYELRLLEAAGSDGGIQLLLLTDKAAMEQTLDYIVQGNTAQMQDAAFTAELKQWIRFDDAEAVHERDGLFARASGSMVVPRWLGRRLFERFFTAKSENDKYARQVRSSAGIAVFVSAGNDRAHWLQVGRCYQRFALQATALGIRNAFLNQPVEVASLRPQFARYLDVGDRRPDLVVRFGRGPEMPRSLRRPLEEVLA